jgi:hypothetical protein
MIKSGGPPRARVLQRPPDLLEISAYQADDRELIGKDPRECPLGLLALKFRAQDPLKALREMCLDCCCRNAAEVRKCVAAGEEFEALEAEVLLFKQVCGAAA